MPKIPTPKGPGVKFYPSHYKAGNTKVEAAQGRIKAMQNGIDSVHGHDDGNGMIVNGASNAPSNRANNSHRQPEIYTPKHAGRIEKYMPSSASFGKHEK